MKYQGIKLEDYAKYIGKTVDEFKEEIKKNSARNVKGRLVLERLIRDEKLEIAEKDIEDRVAEMAKETGKTVEEAIVYALNEEISITVPELIKTVRKLLGLKRVTAKMKKAAENYRIKQQRAEERKNTYQKMFYSNIFNSPEREDENYEPRDRSIGKRVYEKVQKNSVSFDNCINGISPVRTKSPDFYKFKNINKRMKRNKDQKDDFYKTFYSSNIFYSPNQDLSKYDKPSKSQCKKQYNNVKNDDCFKEIRKKPLPYKLITGRKLLKERVLTDTLGQKKADNKKRTKYKNIRSATRAFKPLVLCNLLIIFVSF